MKRFIFAAIAFFCLCIAAQAQKQKMPALNAVPFGVNLAGAEFGKIGSPEYYYPTAEELDYFKAKGLTLFRFPFKWERIQPELNGPLDTKELDNMKTFVDAARARGVWVILDMHNYGRRHMHGKSHLIGSPEVSVAHVADAWQKLAKEFKGYDNIWAYGIMNEPHDMLDSTPWFTIAQGIITGIRQADKKTAIAVGGDSWSSAARWASFSENLKNLKDPANNLVFEAHVYFDKDASGSYAKSYEEEAATPTTGVERATPFVQWLKENNFRGFIGEYGVPAEDQRWLVVLDNMLTYLKENNVGGTYWAAGPRWGNYRLSVEPRDGADRPQMEVLEKYRYANAPAAGSGKLKAKK